MKCCFQYTYPYPKSSVIHGLLRMRIENQEPDFYFEEISKADGTIYYRITHQVHPLLVPMLGSKMIVYEDIQLYKDANTIGIETRSDIKTFANVNPSINSTSTITELNDGTCLLLTTLTATINVPSFLEAKVRQTLKKRYVELRQKEESFMR